MARYGKRVDAGLADAIDRGSTEGKNAVIWEVIHVMPTSDVVTIYNSNQTAYGTAPTDVTTGAAILKHIKHALAIIPVINLVTGGPTTSTALRPLAIKFINGPTTIGKVWATGCPQAGGSGLAIAVLGKTF